MFISVRALSKDRQIQDPANFKAVAREESRNHRREPHGDSGYQTASSNFGGTRINIRERAGGGCLQKLWLRPPGGQSNGARRSRKRRVSASLRARAAAAPRV